MIATKGEAVSRVGVHRRISSIEQLKFYRSLCHVGNSYRSVGSREASSIPEISEETLSSQLITTASVATTATCSIIDAATAAGEAAVHQFLQSMQDYYYTTTICMSTEKIPIELYAVEDFLYVCSARP